MIAQRISSLKELLNTSNNFYKLKVPSSEQSKLFSNDKKFASVDCLANSKKTTCKPTQYDFKAELLACDAEKVGKYGFAQLKPVNIIPTGEFRTINYLSTTPDRNNFWFHCFVDDKYFNAFWNNPYKYDKLILEAKGFISTDWSLYRNMGQDEIIWNCRKNRAHAYHIQSLSENVIPTAGFGAEWTWEFCFDGLPDNSTVAITTNGGLSDPEAIRLFVGGVDALVKSKHPRTILVCGNYPNWLNTKYPDITIIQIPNFKQIMRKMKEERK